MIEFNRETLTPAQPELPVMVGPDHFHHELRKVRWRNFRDGAGLSRALPAPRGVHPPAFAILLRELRSRPPARDAMR
jgi:hypothetical protein